MTNKLTVNISDYLTDEDILNECKDQCRRSVQEYLTDKKNMERVLSNMAYSASYKFLDDCLTDEMMSSIKLKTREIIESDSSFGLFRKKDAWGAVDSPAYSEQKRAMEEHKHLISPLVKKAIQDRDYSEALESLEYSASEIISEGLRMAFDKKDEN